MPRPTETSTARVRTERRGAVTVVTLDHPAAHNAIDAEMAVALAEAIEAFGADGEARVLVVTGAGERSFCAGANLKGVAALLQHGWTERAGPLGFARLDPDKPTIAAVNGVAVGPGAHLALACDFVLVHETTRFLWSFARWGLVVDAGGAYLLPRLVGLPRAKAMVMLGEGCTGSDAVDLGLAYRCVPAGDLDDEAAALAARLAAGPTRSLGLSKRLLNASFETDLGRALESEAAAQSLATTSSDLVEGMAAFKERRDPDFTGR